MVYKQGYKKSAITASNKHGARSEPICLERLSYPDSAAFVFFDPALELGFAEDDDDVDVCEKLQLFPLGARACHVALMGANGLNEFSWLTFSFWQ